MNTVANQCTWIRNHVSTFLSLVNKVLPVKNVVFTTNFYKKHIDASVKERPQTLLVPSEEICKRVLCNKHF